MFKEIRNMLYWDISRKIVCVQTDRPVNRPSGRQMVLLDRDSDFHIDTFRQLYEDAYRKPSFSDCEAIRRFLTNHRFLEEPF